MYNVKIQGNLYEINMRIRMSLTNREKMAVKSLLMAVRMISQRKPDLAIRHAEDAIVWLQADASEAAPVRDELDKLRV